MKDKMMWRVFFITLLMMVFVCSDAVIAPAPAFAQGRSVQVGTTINQGHRIGCSQGSRLLRMRGFHTVRTLDCRGSHFLYRATRLGRSYDITIRARDGRITHSRPFRVRR
ncbi:MULTISPECIES: hypothetical protein [Brucella]|nr:MULTISPECIES: hypothetical protein [Brucella]